MIDLPIDKKLRKRVAQGGAALGAVIGALSAYLVYPEPSKAPLDPDTLQRLRDEEINEDYVIPPIARTRTFGLIFFGILGGGIGVGLSGGIARDLQRKRDLRELVNQGKKKS